MKAFLLSDTGTATGIARRIQDDGHPVSMFVAEDRKQFAGEGIVPRVKAWREPAKEADIVIVEGLVPGDGSAWLEKNTKLVFGGNCDGVAIEPSQPHDEIVQIIGFWTGRYWVSPMFRQISVTRLLAGELGPNVAAMGTIVEPLERVPEAVMDMMQELGKGFRSQPYRGMVTFEIAHSGAEDDHWRLIAVNVATDHMALMSVLELTPDSPMDFLLEIAAGVKKAIPLRADVVAAARVSVPPWPYFHPGELGNTIIPITIDAGALKHFWEADLLFYQDGELAGNYAAGLSGFLGFATARGRRDRRKRDIIREPLRRLHKVISGIHAPRLQYRFDLDDALHTKLIWIEDKWPTKN